MYERICRALATSERTLVVGHVNPDGDVIGSCLALASALRALGKEAVCYNESPVPMVYNFIPGAGEVVDQVVLPGDFDAVAVLDCSDIERVGMIARQIQKMPLVVNLDHHATNEGYGHLACVEDNACATAEIIYRLIKKWGLSFDLTMATGLYTAILTDTGSFRFANTSHTAFSICNEMVSCGVDPYHVAQHVYGDYSLGRIKLLNMALGSIELLEDGSLSFMTLTRHMMARTGTSLEDADGMINYAKQIEDVRMAAMIAEDPHQAGHYYISLRSDGSIDVSELATNFGGGGHVRAAGFNTDLPPALLKERILEWSRGQNMCRDIHQHLRLLNI